MALNPKRRSLEEVLRVPLTDDQAEHIATYYRQFFDNPEGYMRDSLVDVILDDLDLGRLRLLPALMNEVDGMHITKFGPHSSIVWGTYKEQPIYAIPVNNQEIIASLREFDTEMIGQNAQPDELVAEVMFSKDGEAALIVVRSVEAMHAVGELPFTITDGMPGYEKGFMRRLVSGSLPDLLSIFYVCFVAAGKGSNPVLWPNLVNQTFVGADDEMDSIVERETDMQVGIFNDHIQAINESIKTRYPHVDMESHEADDKYHYLSYGHKYNLVYNSNTLAYNGNVSSAKRLFPLLAMISMVQGATVSNAPAVVMGASEWNELYFSSKEVAPEETVHQQASQVLTPEMNQMLDNIGNNLGHQSRQRGQGTATSPIGKLLQNASSDYEQV